MIPGILAEARAELAGCEQGGRHRPTRNEHADAWCSKCGERLLLPFAAGWRRLVDWMLAQPEWCLHCGSDTCQHAATHNLAISGES